MSILFAIFAYFRIIRKIETLRKQVTKSLLLVVPLCIVIGESLSLFVTQTSNPNINVVEGLISRSGEVVVLLIVKYGVISSIMTVLILIGFMVAAIKKRKAEKDLALWVASQKEAK